MKGWIYITFFLFFCSCQKTLVPVDFKVEQERSTYNFGGVLCSDIAFSGEDVISFGTDRVIRVCRADGSVLEFPDKPGQKISDVISGKSSCFYVDTKGGAAELFLENQELVIRKMPAIPVSFRNIELCRFGDQIYALTDKAAFFQFDGRQWLELEKFPGRTQGAKLIPQFDGIYLFQMRLAALTGDQTWVYRPVPRDGTTEKGWMEMSLSPARMPGVLFPVGQAHIVEVADSVRSYHTITDSWVTHGINKYKRSPFIFSDGSTQYLLNQDDVGIDIFELKLTSDASRLATLDYVTIAVYFIILLFIGFRFSQTSGTSDDYFLGGRKMKWWVVGISLYATGTSAISFLAIPTKTFVTNQVYAIGTLWGPVFMLLVAWLIVPILRGINITTTYQYLERRFGLPVRILGAVQSVAFQLGGRMSVVLLLPSLALTAVTGMNVFYAIALMGLFATFYTVLGGISAVIWTDVVQVAVLFGGAVLAFVLMISGTDGGLSGYLSINMAYGKLNMFQSGWDWAIPVFWVFMLNQLMTQAAFPSDQVMVQRVLTTPSIKAARKSYIMLGLIVVPGTLLFHFLGSSMFSFFHSHPELANPSMENIQLFPLYIVQALPSGITGLVIAALFAACMSTLDSSMNSVSAVVVTDFISRFKKVENDEVMRYAKIITLLVGLAGTGIALLMATLDIKSIFDLWMEIIALIGGGFGGIYLLGIFTRRANSGGVITGALSSILITIYAKNSTDMHFMLYSTVAVGSCVVIGYLASFLFPKVDRDLTGLTFAERIRE